MDDNGNAEWLFNWVANSQPLYKRAKLAASRTMPNLRAQLALSAAVGAFHEMRQGGEPAEDITAADLLDAAKLLLSWDWEAN